MPTPSSIGDLSQVAASNFPAGSDSPALLDDVQRAQASFIAMLRDGKGFSVPVTLASAATTDIGAQNALAVEITGTTTITSFGTSYNGPRFLRFTGALILTHNATTLNLPGAANITTAAGDAAIAYPNTTGNGWNVASFQRAASLINSLIRLNTGNGVGSTLTAIRRFTNVGLTQGSDITYADSAANGALFTINTAGVYAISYTDQFNASNFLGLSLNTTTGGVSIATIAVAERLISSTTIAANAPGACSWSGFLASGSLIRPHVNASAVDGATTALTSFSIARVA